MNIQGKRSNQEILCWCLGLVHLSSNSHTLETLRLLLLVLGCLCFSRITVIGYCTETQLLTLTLSLLQNFLTSSSCPEIQGYLYVKEVGRKSWKKVLMFLRRSGLYCSTKGTSKVTAFSLFVNIFFFCSCHFLFGRTGGLHI